MGKTECLRLGPGFERRLALPYHRCQLNADPRVWLGALCKLTQDPNTVVTASPVHQSFVRDRGRIRWARWRRWCLAIGASAAAREHSRRADAAIVVRSADHDGASVGGQHDRGCGPSHSGDPSQVLIWRPATAAAGEHRASARREARSWVIRSPRRRAGGRIQEGLGPTHVGIWRIRLLAGASRMVLLKRA